MSTTENKTRVRAIISFVLIISLVFSGVAVGEGVRAAEGDISLPFYVLIGEKDFTIENSTHLEYMSKPHRITFKNVNLEELDIPYTLTQGSLTLNPAALPPGKTFVFFNDLYTECYISNDGGVIKTYRRPGTGAATEMPLYVQYKSVELFPKHHIYLPEGSNFTVDETMHYLNQRYWAYNYFGEPVTGTFSFEKRSGATDDRDGTVSFTPSGAPYYWHQFALNELKLTAADNYANAPFSFTYKIYKDYYLENPQLLANNTIKGYSWQGKTQADLIKDNNLTFKIHDYAAGLNPTLAGLMITFIGSYDDTLKDVPLQAGKNILYLDIAFREVNIENHATGKGYMRRGVPFEITLEDADSAVSQPDDSTVSQPDDSTVSQPDDSTVSQPDDSTPEEPEVAPVETTSIKTSAKTIYLKKGQSLTLPIAHYTADGRQDTLKYTSSKTKVATVSKTGKVKAKKKGTTKITIEATNGKKLTIKIYVVNQAEKNEKISVKAPKTLKVGASRFLNVKVTKGATKAAPTFKSSKKSVLTVDKAGKITAIKKGKAQITIKAGAQKKVIKITVK